MSSHGGQQNFPFGCMAHTSDPFVVDPVTYNYCADQQENIHGLGLPEFIHPGPPPGQPLLNAHENRDLDNFFQDFDQNAAANKNIAQSQFNIVAGSDQYYGMPPMFVGSDTSLGPRYVVDTHQLQGAGLSYGHGIAGQHMNVNAVKQPNTLASGMPPGVYHDTAFPDPLITQLQTAASMQPAFGPGWQHSFAPHGSMDMPQLQGRQAMAFGTDSRFQPTGYAAPNNPLDPDIPQAMQTHPMDWFESASASTTQPNTRPNTQPSSPNWSKKRTFEDFQGDQNPRNGFVQGNIQQIGFAQASPPKPNPRRKPSAVVKYEQGPSSQPPTPLPNSKPHTPLDREVRAVDEVGNHEQDAEAEAEDDDAATESARSPSPAPWPAHKARPSRNPNPAPPKGTRKKRASTTSSPAVKSKSKAQRTSGGSQVANSIRVPLTQEQKKANHTSSEQRRRDATARSYAELYDLVPELDVLGKQSTMKKLEVVVAKVQRVKQRVETLRARLGLDPVSGRSFGPSPYTFSAAQ